MLCACVVISWMARRESRDMFQLFRVKQSLGFRFFYV